MTTSIEKSLHNYLEKLDIKIPYTYIENLIQSHSNYPSLLSITETLCHLGIAHECLEVEKERVSEIPLPFMAHLSGSTPTFLIIDTMADAKNENFLKLWDGIIIVVEKNIDQFNPSNELINAEKIEKMVKNTRLSFFLLATFFSLSVIYFNQTFFAISLILSCFAGIFISILILREEHGIADNFTKKICSISKYIDCKEVLSSSGSKIFKSKLTLGDVCFIYFNGFMTSIIITSFVDLPLKNIIGLVAWILIFSIPITIYSLYYQAFVLKKWCLLCILCITFLWIQGGIIIPHLESNPIYLFNASKIILLGYTIPTIMYFSFKNLWNENRKLKHDSLKGKRFKKLFELFLPSLFNERQISYELNPNEILVGNTNATVEIIIALSTSCGPCIEAQKNISEIMKSFKNNVKIVYKFLITDTKNDIVTIHVLKKIKEEPEKAFEIISTWYEVLDLTKFKNLYKLNDEDIEIENLILAQKTFFNNYKIEHTPTVFINKFQLPNHYNIYDIKFFIPGLLSHFSK